MSILQNHTPMSDNRAIYPKEIKKKKTILLYELNYLNLN